MPLVAVSMNNMRISVTSVTFSELYT
jgi:hypothetical protein